MPLGGANVLLNQAMLLVHVLKALSADASFNISTPTKPVAENKMAPMFGRIVRLFILH